MRRRECSLLNLGKVVLWIPVQGELAKPAQWHLIVRPNLGQVENVPTEFLRLFGTEDLYITGPGWVVASGDSLEQVLCMPVHDG